MCSFHSLILDKAFLSVFFLTLNFQGAVRIHEAVVSHYHNILRDFESIDYAKIGTVSPTDFREVLSRHVMRINDDQV